MWKRLSEEGIFVNVVLPPAAPAGGCLIRMSDEQIDRVLAVLERTEAELGVIPDRLGLPAGKRTA